MAVFGVKVQLQSSKGQSGFFFNKEGTICCLFHDIFLLSYLYFLSIIHFLSLFIDGKTPSQRFADSD